jgi:Nickel responsive protein SCO4226-like
MPPGNTIANTYLVEHYQPGLDQEALQGYAAQVHAAANALREEGKRVRNLRSTILPDDESLLCLFEADSEQLVRDVYARAALPFDRISQAVALDDTALPTGIAPKEEP